MSYYLKQWKQIDHKQKYNPYESIIETLSHIHNIKNLPDFLKPSSNSIIDPTKLSNIKPFVARVVKAIQNSEVITISSDPDICKTMMESHL